MNRYKRGITGIILAGGKSSRFGTDKALIKLNNKTLLEIAIDKMQLICDSVLISYNSPLPEHISYKQIPDKIQSIGPMGGLYTCLEVSNTELNMILSVDAPFVPTDLFSLLTDYTQDYNVVIPRYKENIYPLIGLYKKSFLKILEKDISNKRYKMMKAIKKSKHSVVEISDASEFYNDTFFMNINTREDLKTAEESIRMGP